MCYFTSPIRVAGSSGSKGVSKTRYPSPVKPLISSGRNKPKRININHLKTKEIIGDDSPDIFVPIADSMKHLGFDFVN